ncbi:MAG: branched-chain amino acid ABC transporter substrate-binding protein [Rhodospirillales bacterium]|jgi:branched-chain amino acid transport system substrate-binding protein|nr:branched-chain amino acid ABC transporter substrate-binding protein [Rhodospirillales bacterium]
MFQRWLLIAGLVLYPVASQAETVFAVVGGMSGSYAPIGSWFKNGSRGAVDEINSSGGLLGEKIDFIVRDDECDAGKAKTIAGELAGLKVPFVMGHLCSDASIAASDIYEKNGIVAISPSSTNPALTERGFSNIFRTTGRDDMQGFVLAEHILRNFKTKALGFIYDQTAYSRGVVDVAKKFVSQAGKSVAFSEPAPEGSLDFSAVLDKIEENNVQVILYPALPEQLAEFVKQRAKRGLKFVLLGGDTFTNITVEKRDIRLLDGVQFSFPPDPAHDRRNKAIVKKYKAQGINPEAFTFYSYAAVQVWAQAVREAGTFEAGKVSKVLKSMKFDTVLGEIGFDRKGDISNPGFVMYIYNKGKRYYFE